MISWHIKFVDDPVVTSVDPVPGIGVVTGAAVVIGTKGQAETDVTELVTWPPTFFNFEGFGLWGELNVWRHDYDRDFRLRKISGNQSWASHWIWPCDQLCWGAKPNRSLFDARFSTVSTGYQTLGLDTSAANSTSRTMFSWPPSDRNSVTEKRKSVISRKQFRQLSNVFIAARFWHRSFR